MSDVTASAAAEPPAPETPLQQTEAHAVSELEHATRTACALAFAAFVDETFTAHLNSLPIACEAAMRPLIEAARKDLKAGLAKL